MPGQRSREEGFLSICWSGSDLFVKGCGFFRGRETQFCFEDAHTLLVLAQSGSTLTGLGVQLHQVAMRRFVQGIQRQPAPGVGDGRLVRPLGTVTAHQSLQGGGQFLAQALGLKELPLVEVGAIAQAEAGQEVSPIKFDCLSQGSQTLGTHVGLWMIVLPAGPQQTEELIHVQPKSLP